MSKKKTILVISAAFLLFIVWMNLTPGHFQKSYCGCNIEYYEYKKEHTEGLMCPSGCTGKNIFGKLLDNLLLNLSVLDFNK